MYKVNVREEVQIAPDTPPVLGDQRALEQVLANLVSNAVQAMSETGGTLAVKAQPIHAEGEKSKVLLTISDTGPGIPEETLERIFEPFFTTNPQGTGLGLAITRRIITAHKGTIEVKSVPGGTVFQIYLPAAESENG
jgi:signal transduction histidine kinase